MGRGDGSGGWVGQGGCERGIEVFGKIHTKKIGGGGGRGRVGGGLGGCDQRLEAFVKIQKKIGGGGGGVGGGGGGGRVGGKGGCE